MKDFAAVNCWHAKSVRLLLLLLLLQQLHCGQTADELSTHLQQQQQMRSSSRTRSAVTVSDLSGVGGNSGHRTSPMAQQRYIIAGQQQQQQQEQLSVAMNDVECPSFAENSACPCYKYEDGIFLECPGITFGALRHTLQIIGSPIQSLSVYDFDRTVKSLTSELFGGSSTVGNPQSGPVMLDPSSASGGPGSGANVTIRHLQFSHSSLKQLRQDSLLPLRAHLKSLRIANGKLDEVPTKSISDLKKLMVLDFESNEIKSINEYAFYGLHLVKINLKGNHIGRVPLNGFAGLEDTLTELDLSENRLRQFPTLALRRLENLRLVRLASNDISALEQDDSYTRFGSLTFLDLSQNALVELYADFFGAFPALRTLSLYGNDIETVHRDALVSLKELQSLDLSQNRLIQLHPDLFAANRRLHTVDLSRNHIHYLSGLFSNLPLLREIFINENNVLELTDDCFANSTSLKVIYLEHNAIQRLDSRTLATLTGLEQLFLSHNLIRRVPALFFEATPGLLSIALDDNEIDELDGRLFRRLGRLREARLNGNRLQLIEERLFAATEELMELHLQANRLSVIERGAFQACQQLQYINLQDNELEEIETIFAEGAPLAALGGSLTTGSLANQSPLMAVTTYGKLISKTESVTNGDSHLGGGQESALLSIQLNGNTLRHLHGHAFLHQTSLQMVWLQDNRLTTLDRTLFAELVHLEKLCLRNNTLLALEPGTLDPLVRLRYLDLSHNRLTDLTEQLFRGLAELEELHLAHNQLAVLRPHVFGRLVGLRMLDLSYNPDLQTRLDPAAFQPALPVSSLNLRGCNLTSLPASLFHGFANLNELLLDENDLAAAGELQPTIDASALRTLRLSANAGIGLLKEHQLERLPSLQMLYLERCDITELAPGVLRKTVNLVKLDLSHNSLRTLPRNVFTGLHVFKELRLHGNEFGELPGLALLNVSALEVLVLSRNQLTFVDFYRFAGGMPNLRTLDLHDNSITALSGLHLDALPHLDTLDLSSNLLLALPEPFFKHSAILQRVDLSQNRLGAIPNAALSGQSLARLTWLNLSGNPLRRIATTSEAHDQSPHDYPHLKELHISATNLSIVTSKDFELYPALQTLRLVQNRIARISPGAFFGLGALQTLDLSVNELELLPKERLQGLRQLELLNISTNSIRELDEFAQDLRRLRILDASTNQLERLQKNTLRHLVGLQELYLNGNRLVTVSSEAFRTLRALTVLDLRKNYFEYAPLRALKPLETHLQQFRIEDNPLTCSCDTQELWQLLSDHRKWTRGFDGVRCEQPAEMQGKLLLQLEPQEFCDVPLIQKIAIQDIQPYSVLVSWQNREYSGLHGYHIIYHSLDTIEDIRGKTMNRSSNSAKLTRLSSNTRYLICVLGLGSWLTYENDIHELLNQSNQLQNQILTSGTLHARYANGELDASLSNTLLSLMMDTPTSRCTEVRTLNAIGLHAGVGAEESGQPGESLLHSILTRRLGLIVGCCLGIVVFIVLVSVLGWLKIKKRRLEAAKRQQQPHQPEFISYRHFSIPNDELGRDGVAGDPSHRSGGGIGSASFGTYTTDGHPAFISGAVLGTMATVGDAPGSRHDERKKIFMTGS
ncbi:chaoptin [Anopheles aquasalis]|uniref:chaoptin n=1 Tax=Anopheles aquasalis TaxID=42839 RepID=UPI00215A11F3|nr:chaoptin [Anopheles aquasalis]XP_050084509.1 chaoptin [Anopheles aquasalis]XP_050084517.1 chaoptin [Anopheles aquasalis]XP_050084525.1 chaoptin [Anopheles aquasalis]XP_050084534.1 chaoptin [Anopheles aquasalis]